MVDKTRLLDAVVGGLSKAAARSGGGAGKPTVADAAQAALVGVAGLFLTSRRTRGITGSGKLGSLAQLAALGIPEASGFHPVSQTEDDALLYLRAMVAAAAADGQIDAAERARIAQGMRQAGIDEEATRWLENELAEPADVEELAAGVETPEKAAQVYTAARLAIDPDSIQERTFLTNLAQGLDLDQRLRDQIDATAAAARS